MENKLKPHLNRVQVAMKKKEEYNPKKKQQDLQKKYNGRNRMFAVPEAGFFEYVLATIAHTPYKWHPYKVNTFDGCSTANTFQLQNKSIFF